MKINHDIMSTYIFIIKLYENKPGHYKHIYFNLKLYENKSGHYCIYWTLTGFPYIPFVSLVKSLK